MPDMLDDKNNVIQLKSRNAGKTFRAPPVLAAATALAIASMATKAAASEQRKTNPDIVPLKPSSMVNRGSCALVGDSGAVMWKGPLAHIPDLPNIKSVLVHPKDLEALRKAKVAGVAK